MTSQSNDPSQAWLAWQLRHGAGAVDPVPLFHQTLRTRSGAGLDALAELATGGRQSPQGLLAEVLAEGAPPGDSLRPARRRALAGVAFAWAGMLRTPEELLASALVFEALWPGDGLTWLGPQLRLTGLQTLFLAGRHEQLAALLPAVRDLHPDAEHYLRVDLANPHGPATATADEQRWDELLAQRFTERGLAAPSLQADGQAAGAEARSPFDRLEAPGARPGTASGELVTVIMPSWRPDEGLVTAVRSICAQTYADLEIVVVDDCSGPEHAETYARVAALDPRVRVLTMDRNGGSYLGRAAAIEASRGSLITFQDADDWSHPSRVELQVAALEEAGPDTPMTRSRAVRAKDDLTHQWLGYRAVRENASSLLLRRSILARTGGFAPIRKGADSEFAERVARLHGAIVDVREPLAVTRLRSGSLSRGDFTFSWTAPERRAFRSSFMAWHRRLARRRRQEPGELRVQDAELATLPFPVPAAWVRDLPAADHVPDRLGTAYLGSFSQPHGSRGGDWLMRALREGAPGAPAGVWHQDLRATTELRRPELDRALDDPLLDGQAWLVSRLDRITAGRLVVLDPSVLSLMRDQEVRVRADDVEVWLAPEDVTPGSAGLPEDLLGASDLLSSWFGLRPRWVLAPWLDEREQTMVREALPGLDVMAAQAGEVAGAR